jgi:hypothetical protein
MHLLSPIICSCYTLYIFRTVFPSIIRRSKLRIQQRYMSNRCCYLLLSGMRWNWFLCHPSVPGSSSCLTYTVAVYAVLSSSSIHGTDFHLIPDSSRYQQLLDINRCCIRSFELLMIDGKTVRNMLSVLQDQIIWDNGCILLVVIWEFVTDVSGQSVVPFSRVKQSENAGNTYVRGYIGNGVGCDCFSENVTLANRISGAWGRGREEESVPDFLLGLLDSWTWEW